MPLDVKTLLKKLSEVPAPSGHEGPVRDLLRAEWAGLVDAFETDRLGSLIALKRGSGPEPRRKIMVCAHMDEIGLIVAEVRDGFILTAPLGGTDPRVLLMQPVLVHGRRVLAGVFGAAPPHMARERGQYPGWDDLWIDVGLPADEVAELVRVGDIVTFDVSPAELKGDRLVGKSLDNRASVAAVTVCLDELTRVTHAWDVVAVASVQEEVGSLGALTAAYQVQPDVAIAVDVTFGAQSGAGDDESFDLGGGPTLSVGPNFHPRLVKQAREAARGLEMKLQIETLPGDSGTDAWVIQVSREGVPTILFGMPIRNMHTPVEIVDVRDVTRAGRLMAALIARMTPDFLDTIAWPLPDSQTEPN
ncbi:MAG: M42 family metallopeptidase [Chloroflexi bacterium]|nr:M42 family metallopeptidase [Chloroflexota bacterium]